METENLYIINVIFVLYLIAIINVSIMMRALEMHNYLNNP